MIRITRKAWFEIIMPGLGDTPDWKAGQLYTWADFGFRMRNASWTSWRRWVYKIGTEGRSLVSAYINMSAFESYPPLRDLRSRLPHSTNVGRTSHS